MKLDNPKLNGANYVYFRKKWGNGDCAHTPNLYHRTMQTSLRIEARNYQHYFITAPNGTERFHTRTPFVHDT